jgi:branched-chain amino acid transport system substrate-binding protein
MFGLSCGATVRPRIVYPLPWVSSALARVAQPVIDAWGQPRVAELPESLMAVHGLPPGYAGDIAFAEAMAALPGVAVAVGPQSSRATLLVAPVYAERGIPLIVPTATSDAVRMLGPWVFQLAPDNAVEGAFMADFALDRLGARRVTIFYLLADEYGLSLRQGVLEALRRRGIAPVDQVGIIEDTDFPRRVAESLRRSEPDVVLVAARGPEAIAIARAFHARLPRVRLVAGDGAALDGAFADRAGPAAASVYGVAWWHRDRPDSVSRAFAARFERVTGTPPSEIDAMYYDAIMLAAEAVREVGSRPAAIRRWLAALGTTRPAYHGVTGPISFHGGRPANLLMTHLVNDTAAVVGSPEATP